MSSTHAKTTMKTLRGLDTRIVGNKQQPLAINYRLHSVDKEWKIYDLVIEHISVVNTTDPSSIVSSRDLLPRNCWDDERKAALESEQIA